MVHGLDDSDDLTMQMAEQVEGMVAHDDRNEDIKKQLQEEAERLDGVVEEKTAVVLSLQTEVGELNAKIKAQDQEIARLGPEAFEYHVVQDENERLKTSMISTNEQLDTHSKTIRSLKEQLVLAVSDPLDAPRSTRGLLLDTDKESQHYQTLYERTRDELQKFRDRDWENHTDTFLTYNYNYDKIRRSERNEELNLKLSKDIEDLKNRLSALQSGRSDSSIMEERLSGLKDVIFEKEKEVKRLQMHLDLVIGRPRPRAAPGLPIPLALARELHLTAAPDAILVDKIINLEAELGRAVAKEEDRETQVEAQKRQIELHDAAIDEFSTEDALRIQLNETTELRREIWDLCEKQQEALRESDAELERLKDQLRSGLGHDPSLPAMESGAGRLREQHDDKGKGRATETLADDEKSSSTLKNVSRAS
jgi:hypothetical protein